MAELNNYVPIDVHMDALSTESMCSFGIVVVSGTVPMVEAIKMNDACRDAGSVRADASPHFRLA